MTSTFGSLNIALRALQSMQRAIEVSGHNVSNTSTEGYSRQKAMLVAAVPYSAPTANRNMSIGQVGSGVTIQMIQRYRSDFLDSQIRSNLTSLSSWEVRQDVLRQIEVVLNEPSEAGFNTDLSAFWTAWNNLSTTTDSTGNRALVLESAETLSATLRDTYGQLSDLQAELDNQIATHVQTINDLAQRIADLNRTIRDVEAVGQQANDLRDERTRLLKDLSAVVDIEASESETGSVMISLGGKLLVMDHVTSELEVEKDPQNDMLNRIVWADTGAVLNVHGIPLEGGLPDVALEQLGGQLGGALIGRDLILPDKLAQLDDLANAIIGSVNAIHQTGFGFDGAAGGAVSGSSLAPGTVDGFTMVPPVDGNYALADGAYYVEIRDNANTLEFRLVDSLGNPVDIYNAAAGDGSLTGAWQVFDLVDGTSFDTGRGLQIDFSPLADHSLNAPVTDGNVSGFSLSGVSQGTPELAGDTYFVEVRNNGGTWEFRLVDSSGAQVEVYDAAAGDGSLTGDWQAIPAGVSTFDTHRGLSVDLTAGPYTETFFGGVPSPANVGYVARGTQVATRSDGAASVSLANFFTGTGARDIGVSDYIASDTSRIATAADNDSPGDGSIALAIARLEREGILNSGSTTIGDYYRAAVAELGQEAQQAEIMTNNYSLLANHLENRQEEIAGVSLDEETIYLMQYQRTYQAAARVMTTIDEMLEKIINSMGLAGR